MDWLALRLAGLMLAGASLAVGAASGHAASVQESTVRAIGVDALHLLATGIWAGALVPFVLFLRWAWPGGRPDAPPAGAAVIAVRRFSTLGLLSVAILLASGVYAVPRPGQQSRRAPWHDVRALALGQARAVAATPGSGVRRPRVPPAAARARRRRILDGREGRGGARRPPQPVRPIRSAARGRRSRCRRRPRLDDAGATRPDRLALAVPVFLGDDHGLSEAMDSRGRGQPARDRRFRGRPAGRRRRPPLAATRC